MMSFLFTLSPISTARQYLFLSPSNRKVISDLNLQRYKNMIPNNEKIRNYCMNSTNESIAKITEKYNPNTNPNRYIENYFSNASPCLPNNNNNNNPIIPILFFLSTSSMIFYFINLQYKNICSFIRYIENI